MQARAWVATSAALCIQAYLSEAGVDFTDCFERAELIERFRSVKLERSVTDVEQIKAKANAAFKRESYEYAVRLYTEASLAALALFDVDPGRGRSLLVRPCQARAAPSRPGASPELSPRRAKVQLLSNRARAYLELRMPLVAMEDAQQCLQLDPSFIKAYQRLAAAHSALGRCGAYPALPAPCVALLVPSGGRRLARLLPRRPLRAACLCLPSRARGWVDPTSSD